MKEIALNYNKLARRETNRILEVVEKHDKMCFLDVFSVRIILKFRHCLRPTRRGIR